jgi:uncharacterized protein involved in exopolysaccharide biosynthesis
MEEDESKGLSEYLDIFIRRKLLIIFPAIVLSMIAIFIVNILPSTYKSEGLILIEAQEIPVDLVKSTVTSYADQRIQVIKQRIMTTENVMEIVRKFDLYKEMRKKSSPSQVVSQFKSNMAVDMVEANVTDPRSGRKKRASIAFTVSFLDPSPKVAQIVANELVTKFLTENVRTRTEKAAETESFLEEEASKFQKKIQNLEKNIADFKNEYSDSLPELLTYNLSMVQRLEDELVANRNQIMTLKDQVAAFTLEQSTVHSFTSFDNVLPTQGNISSPQEKELIALRSQYGALLSRYSINHPDVISLKKQVDSLEAQLGIKQSEESQLVIQLDEAKSKLVELSKKYSDNHPDVIESKSQIADLEKQLESRELAASINTAKQQQNSPVKKNVNPLYSQLQTKISLTEREIQRLVSRQKEVREKLADFEQRIVKTHQVKRAYDDLIRDHANHLSKYQELRAKQLQAQLAQNLESENKGESFSLIEPPQVPTKAEKPNRPKLMVMGVTASIGFGFGLAILFELLFGGVRGHKAIASITGHPPLVVIPIIQTNNDLRIRRRKKYALGISFIIIAIASTIIFHFFVMNLEILWFKLVRKISLL